MKRVVAIALLVAAPAFGQVRPVASGSDPMQQTVAYAEGQTVVLETAPGFLLTVEFAADEQIKSGAAGDTHKWEVSAPNQASHMFVRPVPGARPTNLTVVTNKRSYYFLLIAAQRMTSHNALSIRFTYPQTATTPMPSAEIPKQPAGTYRLSGAVQIRPSNIWDDGLKTYLDWPRTVEAPAIFAIDASGRENLVNSFVREGKFVIDDVHARLIFRLDRLTARADRKAKGRS